MSISSNNLLKTIVSATDKETQNAKLAIVSDVSSNGAKLRFYGDDIVSQKHFKRLSSYVPNQGDTVLVINVNGSYVIAGKVE